MHIAIPTLDIRRVTFSQYLIYSRRVALQRIQERINAAYAVRAGMAVKRDWKRYIDSLHAFAEEIDTGRREPVPGVTGEMIEKKVESAQSNCNEDEIEWLK